MFEQTMPTHPGGCPCDGCNAERAQYEEARAILEAAGHIPAERSDAQ